MVRWKPSKG